MAGDLPWAIPVAFQVLLSKQPPRWGAFPAVGVFSQLLIGATCEAVYGTFSQRSRVDMRTPITPVAYKDLPIDW
jgi:hypothetical protein